jgi:hypothetical protein
MRELNFVSRIFKSKEEREKHLQKTEGKKGVESVSEQKEKLKMGAENVIKHYFNKKEVDHALLTDVKKARNKYVSPNEMIKQKDGQTTTISEILADKHGYQTAFVIALWEGLDKKEKEMIEKE